MIPKNYGRSNCYRLQRTTVSVGTVIANQSDITKITSSDSTIKEKHLTRGKHLTQGHACPLGGRCFCISYPLGRGRGPARSSSCSIYNRTLSSGHVLENYPVTFSNFLHAAMNWRENEKSLSDFLDWITPSLTFDQVGGGGGVKFRDFQKNGQKVQFFELFCPPIIKSHLSGTDRGL